MPGLAKQLVALPFTGGVDQKTDPWLVEPGKQTSVVNGVFTKQGQIRKRFGMQNLTRSLVGGSQVSEGKRVFYRVDELAFADSNNVYSYLPEDDLLRTADQIPQCSATRSNIVSGATTYSDATVASADGYEVFVWIAGAPVPSVVDVRTGVNIFATIRSSDGSVVSPITQLTSYAPTDNTLMAVRVAIVNGAATVVYTDGTGNVFARQFLLGIPAAGWGTLTTLITDENPFSSYGLDAIEHNSLLYVGYGSTAAPGALVVASFTDTLVPQASLVVDAAAGLLAAVSLATIGTSLIVAAMGSVGGALPVLLKAHRITQALSSVTWSASLESFASFSPTANVGVVAVGTTPIVAWTNSEEIYAGPPSIKAPYVQTNVLNGSSGAVLSSRKQFGVAATSRPFTHNGRAYIFGQASQSQEVSLLVSQGTTVLMDLQQTEAVVFAPGNFRVVSTIAPRLSNNASRSVGSVSNVPSLSDDGFVSCGTVSVDASADSMLNVTRLLATFGGTNLLQPAELGGNVHLSGGTPIVYDGNVASEIGFFQFPDVGLNTSPPPVLSSTGGLLPGGAGIIYQYMVTFEWIDALGQKHESAPSNVMTANLVDPISPAVVVTQTNTVTLNIPHLWLTNRQDDQLAAQSVTSPVSLVVYRTVYQNGSMSSVLHRLTPGFAIASCINKQYGTPGMFTFVDDGKFVHSGDPNGSYSFADDDVAENPILYTTGGVLPNVCPPSATIAHVHKNRLWLAGTDDPNVIWYSKQFVTGEAVAFSDSLTMALSDSGGVTALGTLDDKLIIFKRGAIYVVVGDGPADNGTGNDYTEPQKIASDVGCIEPRSVILTPEGLMFQSIEGIMLLSRSLEVQYIGNPVEDYLASFPVITAAILVGAQNQVRFTCQSTAGSALGISIVYNYLQKNWSTFDIYDVDTTAQEAAMASATISPSGIYTSLTRGGTLYLEKQASSSSAHLDGADNWVPLSVESAWIKVSGVLGFQRVRRVGLLGNSVTNANMTISLAPDYNETYLQTHTWVSGDAAFGPPERMTVHVGSENGMHQKCESMRVKVSDALPTTGNVGTGQGVTLTGVTFEIGAKPDMVRLPAGARE